MRIILITMILVLKSAIAYPQNLETKSYLKKLKTKNIKIIGNLKFAETKNLNIDSIDNKLKLLTMHVIKHAFLMIVPSQLF